MKTEQEIKAKEITTSILENSAIPSEQRLIISQTITGLLGLLELSKFDLLRSLWQPIETAPKDGTSIIGCEKDRSVSEIFFDKQTGFWTYLWMDSDGDSRSDVFSPICWMPLPEPIKE